MRKIMKIGGICFIVMLVIGILVRNDKQGSSQASYNNSNSQIVKNRPEQQSKFIEVVTTAQNRAQNADNDLQKGGALSERNKAICNILRNKSVSNWNGIIKRIDSNSDGKGIFSIEIVDDVLIQTWNNSVSDFSAESLIEPSSKLFGVIANLNKGDEVSFSGSFVSNSDTCIEEQSLTLDGKVLEPEFTFRFKNVKKL